jgi:hypothetical protein
MSPPLVIQRDDGMWSIGWHDDAAGPFASRKQAADVAAREVEVVRAESA